VATRAGDRTVNYDQLVIATGSSTVSGLPFKTLGSTEETIAALHELQEQIHMAESIVVAGAGPTGVETTGELAFKYGNQKKITLVINGDRALPACMPEVSRAAEKELAKLKVELVRNARVTEFKDGLVTLSDGQTLAAGAYLPTFGVRVNSSFVPPSLLDRDGSVRLERSMRVAGLTNVWGVGDVGNLEGKQLVRVDGQVTTLAQNLDAVLRGADGAVKEHKPAEKPLIFVTTGKKSGTGQIGSFKAFSWLVTMTKGKDLFTGKGPGMVAGKNMVQSSI
jgi:NADH dehydrogenase FAD-containing subunit